MHEDKPAPAPSDALNIVHEDNPAPAPSDALNLVLVQEANPAPAPSDALNLVQEANCAPAPVATSAVVHALEVTAPSSRPSSKPTVPPHTAPVPVPSAQQPLNFRSRTVHVTDQTRSRRGGPSATGRLESLVVDRHRRIRRPPLPDRMHLFFERLEVTKRNPGTRVMDYRESSAYRRSTTLSKTEWCDRRRQWDPLYAEEADSIVSESEFGDGRWWMTNGQRSDGSSCNEAI